ncbi:MAG TPA: putative porin [Cyclobacteriaceae bacterium]
MKYVLWFILSSVLLLTQINPTSAQETPTRRGSRIIDDTTKQVYGPTTSTYFYEDEVFLNIEKKYVIDTVIRDFHHFAPYQQDDYTLQDLGNIATASRPIFFEVPEQIGVTSGFTIYNRYWEARRIRHYDTKSPYTNLNVNLGGKGRSITNITFARNINPRWNFGFNYRGYFVDKQILREGKGDRNVRSVFYDLFTSYETADSTYRLFLSYARNRHQVQEFGGVLVEEGYDRSEFFQQNAQRTLTEAEARELRMNLHLFHQYRIGSGLQIYHKFDRDRQGNDYYDEPGQEPEGYYEHIEIDSTNTIDELRFVTVRNEAGIKGNLLKLFYNGYYAIRNFNMDYMYLDADTLHVRTKGAEHYLGGRMMLRLDSLMTLTGWVEFMDNGNFRIEGDLTSRWLEASLRQNQFEPGFMQQAYRGSYSVWNNNFSPVNVTQLSGFLHVRSKVFHLSPGMTLTRMNNYVYFREDTSRVQYVMPQQAGGAHVIFSPEVRMSMKFGRMTLRTRAIYTSMLENSEDAMKIPELFVNAQLAYEGMHFGGNLELHTGVEVHWQSAYDALGYAPEIQQFFVQDPRIAFRSNEFPLVDVFLNAKIKRGRIFVKYHNLVQAITGEGWFPTPYYPGQSNVVDFGFDWSFYD